MLATIRAAQNSPLTGAPLTAVLNTGDSADMHSDLELKWYIDCMDGGKILPNSGAVGVYDGPQAWEEASYAWQPGGGPGNARFGDYGFPDIPNLLNEVVSREVDSPGSPVPWYAVYGNHDSLYFGAFPVDAALRSLAVGDKKPALYPALTQEYFSGWANDPTILTRIEHQLRTQFGQTAGMKDVPGDLARKLIAQNWFMQAHFSTPPPLVQWATALPRRT